MKYYEKSKKLLHLLFSRKIDLLWEIGSQGCLIFAQEFTWLKSVIYSYDNDRRIVQASTENVRWTESTTAFSKLKSQIITSFCWIRA